ncbi:hypothetical protein O3P69_000906 [Scylla paramamosain]|uniref:Uncharacterized protein n=1 Tax=Scylla paramamosain TaxID=85552 RepID=A0AAW0UXF2_SCYPA
MGVWVSGSDDTLPPHPPSSLHTAPTPSWHCWGMPGGSDGSVDGLRVLGEWGLRHRTLYLHTGRSCLPGRKVMWGNDNVPKDIIPSLITPRALCPISAHTALSPRPVPTPFSRCAASPGACIPPANLTPEADGLDEFHGTSVDVMKTKRHSVDFPTHARDESFLNPRGPSSTHEDLPQPDPHRASLQASAQSRNDSA